MKKEVASLMNDVKLTRIFAVAKINRNSPFFILHYSLFISYIPYITGRGCQNRGRGTRQFCFNRSAASAVARASMSAPISPLRKRSSEWRDKPMR